MATEALHNIYIICNVYINVIICHAILGSRVHGLLMWLLFSCYLRTQSTWFISSKSKVRICFGACLYCFYDVFLAISCTYRWLLQIICKICTGEWFKLSSKFLKVFDSNYLQNLHRYLILIIVANSTDAWFKLSLKFLQVLAIYL